jgi:hypothetical protein
VGSYEFRVLGLELRASIAGEQQFEVGEIKLGLVCHQSFFKEKKY